MPTEPTTAELQEFFALADEPWPGPHKDKFAVLAKRIAAGIGLRMARQDAEIERLRTAKPKRDK